MSQTIYARVSDDTKLAVERYASEQSQSLASAVDDLLSRGLEAAAGAASVAELEVRAQELQLELSRVRDAAATMSERLKQVLGSCQCGTALTGHDFLLTGRCPSCSRGVTGILAASDGGPGSVDRAEFGPFLAGIGVSLALIAVIYAATRE